MQTFPQSLQSTVFIRTLIFLFQKFYFDYDDYKANINIYIYT